MYQSSATEDEDKDEDISANSAPLWLFLGH